MKQFFKFLFASCLGVFLAMAIFVLIGVGIVGGLVSQAEKEVKVQPNSLLVIKLNKPIPEQTNNTEMNFFDPESQYFPGLQAMVETIEAAKTDDRIKGIFLDLEMNSGVGPASSSVLRQALEDFKSDGKFVVAYSKYYTGNTYYLASAADKVFVNPMGGVDFRGMGFIIPYFKGMLDKIGVEMNVFYAGDFKSATEPYRLTQMSDANRLQLHEFLDEFYGNFLQDISQSRNKTVEELRAIANTLAARDAQDAVATGLADATAYRDEVINDLRSRVGLESDANIPVIAVEDYAKVKKPEKDYSAGDKIAVIFAEGAIVDGKGDVGAIGDDKYAREIRHFREDKNVKAIVLRVNSPGGSAMASENIWRELSLAKEAGIPIVVSMGDYAASGGYYIACMADTILAQENTITGSIGVFNVLPNTRELMNEKLGITFDTVKTGPFATSLTPFYDVTDAESAIIQESVNDIYEIFLKRVADGRDMTRDEVHAVAQGRIWSGAKAVEINLVDAIGDLDDAIGIAAQMAGLEKYRTTEFPRVKEPLQQLIDEFTNTDNHIKNRALQEELGEYYPYYEYIQSMKQASGVQARMPLVFEWK